MKTIYFNDHSPGGSSGQMKNTGYSYKQKKSFFKNTNWWEADQLAFYNVHPEQLKLLAQESCALHVWYPFYSTTPLHDSSYRGSTGLKWFNSLFVSSKNISSMPLLSFADVWKCLAPTVLAYLVKITTTTKNLQLLVISKPSLKGILL